MRVRRNPIHANPVSTEKKAQIFSAALNTKNVGEASDLYLTEYINAFVTENHLKNHMPLSFVLRMVLFSLAYSLVLFLDIVHVCLYHCYYFLDVVIFIAATVAYVLLLRHMRIDKWLVKETKKRPNDSIDNILASQVSGSINGLLPKIAVFALPIATLVLAGFLFAKPHFIYEENNTGGYSVRYYTLALSNDDDVVVPETHNGRQVNEIRGETFVMLGFKSIKLPSGITEIRGDTFSDCTNLREIVIPDGVTRIGGSAFQNCRNLVNVQLPASLDSIGASAFRECISLRSIALPNKLTKIGQSAFRGCSSLTEVDVPQSVRSIEASAFRECPFLRKIRIPESATLGEKVFKDTHAEIIKY